MTARHARWMTGLAAVALGTLAAYPLAGRPALARDHDRDRNPRIYRAIQALQDAQAELADAKSDFHGHKREAQESVQHALDQLQQIKDW